MYLKIPGGMKVTKKPHFTKHHDVDTIILSHRMADAIEVMSAYI
jgi:hypothetical protein